MVKKSILKAIQKVYELFTNVLDSAQGNSEFDEDLKGISEFFKITPSQALMYSVAYSLNQNDKLFDNKSLNELFIKSPTEFLQCKKDIDALIARGLFKFHTIDSEFNPRSKSCFIDNSLSMYELLAPNFTAFQDINIMENILTYGEMDSEEKSIFDYQVTDYLLNMNFLIDENKNLNLFSQILKYDLSDIDRWLLLHLIWSHLKGSDGVEFWSCLDHLFKFNKPQQVCHLQRLLKKESNLFNKDIAILYSEETPMGSYLSIRLSDNFLSVLNKIGVKISREENLETSKATPLTDLIKPNSITSKELFYTKEISNQMTDLIELFKSEKTYRDTIQRVKDISSQNGITIILHGAPGTGKTEWVKQLALKSDRAILKVEMANIRDMYVGQSERNLKGIFTTYKNYLRSSENTPILLFNEADALIGTRNSEVTSGAMRSEYTLQNILLEELETFEGIFIATTNMLQSFDPAFDRRFLYKIEINSPDTEAQIKIWKNKLPFLTNDECKLLAKEFNLTGSLIENIIKKAKLNSILKKSKISYEDVVILCKNDFKQKSLGSIAGNSKGRKIGYSY